MTRRLRVPGLLDVIMTEEPATIARLAAEPQLDRDFDGGGPLVNRIVFRRIRRILRARGEPIAGVTPRDDLDRARRQKLLAQELAKKLEAGEIAPQAIADLAKWVRAERGAPAPGPALQGAIGRLFVTDFAGSSKTWKAAQTVDAAPRNINPLKRLRWILTGEPERSRRLLTDSVNGDPAALHGIAIALHTLLRSLTALRDIRREPQAELVAPEIAAARALRAPPSVVRRWNARTTTPEGDVRPGTMVVFDLQTANSHSPGDRMAFMSDTWSECPARHWSRALLEAVWAEATGQKRVSGIAPAEASVEGAREAAS